MYKIRGRFKKMHGKSQNLRGNFIFSGGISPLLLTLVIGT